LNQIEEIDPSQIITIFTQSPDLMLKKNNKISESHVVDISSDKILEFRIEGMTCSACSNTIENALKDTYSSQGLKTV
jgi:hypothetical protein